MSLSTGSYQKAEESKSYFRLSSEMRFINICNIFEKSLKTLCIPVRFRDHFWEDAVNRNAYMLAYS